MSLRCVISLPQHFNSSLRLLSWPCWLWPSLTCLNEQMFCYPLKLTVFLFLVRDFWATQKLRCSSVTATRIRWCRTSGARSRLFSSRNSTSRSISVPTEVFRILLMTRWVAPQSSETRFISKCFIYKLHFDSFFSLPLQEMKDVQAFIG